MSVSVVGALAAACSDGGGNRASVTLGPAGGEVSLSGRASVQLPAGALAVPTKVSVEQVSGAVVPGSLVQASEVYRLKPEGLAFAAPAKVTLAFDPARIPATARAKIRVYTAPAGSGRF